MNRETQLNSILIDWASRSPNGLLSDITSEENLEALYESLTKEGISESVVVEIVNEVSVISEKGKHPERQAYNKNGILVTFPTPEYKQRALKAGTHTEQNPKATQSNLFGGGNQAPSQATTGALPPTNPMDSGQGTLPKSDSSSPQTPPPQKDVPDPGTPGTPATSSPTPSSAPTTGTPAQGQLASEPIPQQNTPPAVAPPVQPPTPAPVQKTPEEVAKEKEVIKQMLNTTDTLPNISGVGGVGLTEQLKQLAKIAVDLNLNEAVKFLSGHIV